MYNVVAVVCPKRALAAKGPRQGRADGPPRQYRVASLEEQRAAGLRLDQPRRHDIRWGLSEDWMVGGRHGSQRIAKGGTGGKASGV